MYEVMKHYQSAETLLLARGFLLSSAWNVCTQGNPQIDAFTTLSYDNTRAYHHADQNHAGEKSVQKKTSGLTIATLMIVAIPAGPQTKFAS